MISRNANHLYIRKMDNTFEIKSKDYSTFIIWTNSAIAGLAIMIIAGWMLHFSPFKILFPTSISMKFNTAFCFILLTLSLLIRLAYQNKFLSQLSNWLLFTVLQVGILSFIEDKFKLDFGIDEFFSKDYEAANEKLLYPGRMSPLTAICFTCISISMLGLQTRKNGFIQFIQSLFHFVTLLSFVAILGYVFNVPTFYKLSYVTSMAVHTAVAFFFFSIALSLLNPTKGITGLFTGNGIGNMMARKLFLQITCFSVLLAYIRILTHKYGILNVEFGIALFAFSFILLSLLLIWKTSQELNTIDLKRKEVEINLLEIKTFLDSTPYPMLIINENGGIEEVNEQAKKAFGYLNAELIGEAIDKLIPERFLENYTAKLNALYTTPTIRSIGMDIDFFLSKKDGTEFPAEIYLNTIKYGEQLWVSAAIWDISERKEKEKKSGKYRFDFNWLQAKPGLEFGNTTL